MLFIEIVSDSIDCSIKLKIWDGNGWELGNDFCMGMGMGVRLHKTVGMGRAWEWLDGNGREWEY